MTEEDLIISPKLAENNETQSIESITDTQLLHDTRSFMKRSKNFFKFAEKPNGDVYWKIVYIKPLGENGIQNEMESMIYL